MAYVTVTYYSVTVTYGRNREQGDTMATSTGATPRQLDALQAAARRAGFDSPQQAVAAAGVTSGNWKYDLSKADASDVIDQLRNGLKPLATPSADVSAVGVDGHMDGNEALKLLGKTITYETRKGSVVRGRVQGIVLSTEDNTPALSIDVIRSEHTARSSLRQRFHTILTYTVEDD